MQAVKKREMKQKLRRARRLIWEVQEDIDQHRRALAPGDCSDTLAMKSERLAIALDIIPQD